LCRYVSQSDNGPVWLDGTVQIRQSTVDTFPRRRVLNLRNVGNKLWSSLTNSYTLRTNADHRGTMDFNPRRDSLVVRSFDYS